MMHKINKEQIETIRRQLENLERILIVHTNYVENIIYRHGSIDEDLLDIRRAADGLIIIREILARLPSFSALEELADQSE